MSGAADPPFPFLRRNPRPEKPRTRGITSIRGPYYTPLGPRALADVLDLASSYVDILKFSGGAFTLFPERVVREMIDLCHEHGVRVSTGGFLERVLTQGADAVDPYIEECARLAFDIIEVSTGFLSAPPEDLARITERIVARGMEVDAEVGILHGAGGATPEGSGSISLRDPRAAIDLARRQLDAGTARIVVESEGITEEVDEWRTEVIEEIAAALPLEVLLFEAAEPAVFRWYVQRFGPAVNLFVDHSQVIELEALRQGVWGPADLWGRVVALPDD